METKGESDHRESREFRDSRDSSSEKTPFVKTPFRPSESWLDIIYLFSALGLEREAPVATSTLARTNLPVEGQHFPNKASSP